MDGRFGAKASHKSQQDSPKSINSYSDPRIIIPASEFHNLSQGVPLKAELLTTLGDITIALNYALLDGTSHPPEIDKKKYSLPNSAKQSLYQDVKIAPEKKVTRKKNSSQQLKQKILRNLLSYLNLESGPNNSLVSRTTLTLNAHALDADGSIVTIPNNEKNLQPGDIKLSAHKLNRINDPNHHPIIFTLLPLEEENSYTYQPTVQCTRLIILNSLEAIDEYFSQADATIGISNSALRPRKKALLKAFIDVYRDVIKIIFIAQQFSNKVVRPDSLKAKYSYSQIVYNEAHAILAALNPLNALQPNAPSVTLLEEEIKKLTTKLTASKKRLLGLKDHAIKVLVNSEAKLGALKLVWQELEICIKTSQENYVGACKENQTSLLLLTQREDVLQKKLTSLSQRIVALKKIGLAKENFPTAANFQAAYNLNELQNTLQTTKQELINLRTGYSKHNTKARSARQDLKNQTDALLANIDVAKTNHGQKTTEALAAINQHIIELEIPVFAPFLRVAKYIRTVIGTANTPGTCLQILENAKNLPSDAELTACQSAINTVHFLAVNKLEKHHPLLSACLNQSDDTFGFSTAKKRWVETQQRFAIFLKYIRDKIVQLDREFNAYHDLKKTADELKENLRRQALEIQYMLDDINAAEKACEKHTAGAFLIFHNGQLVSLEKEIADLTQSFTLLTQTITNIVSQVECEELFCEFSTDHLATLEAQYNALIEPAESLPSIFSKAESRVKAAQDKADAENREIDIYMYERNARLNELNTLSEDNVLFEDEKLTHALSNARACLEKADALAKNKKFSKASALLSDALMNAKKCYADVLPLATTLLMHKVENSLANATRKLESLPAEFSPEKRKLRAKELDDIRSHIEKNNAAEIPILTKWNNAKRIRAAIRRAKENISALKRVVNKSKNSPATNPDMDTMDAFFELPTQQDMADQKLETARSSMTSEPDVGLVRQYSENQHDENKPGIFTCIGKFLKRNWKPILISTAVTAVIVGVAAGLVVAGVFTFGIVPAVIGTLATALSVSAPVATGLGISAFALSGACVGAIVAVSGSAIGENCCWPNSRKLTENIGSSTLPKNMVQRSRSPQTGMTGDKSLADITRSLHSSMPRGVSPAIPIPKASNSVTIASSVLQHGSSNSINSAASSNTSSPSSSDGCIHNSEVKANDPMQAPITSPIPVKYGAGNGPAFYTAQKPTPAAQTPTQAEIDDALAFLNGTMALN